MTNLLVLGMHRSGTSALAGALAKCGYYLGPDLLPPVPDFNDTGFFESETVVAIHDEFLRACGVDWRYCYRLTDDCFEGAAAAAARENIRKVVTQLESNQPWCIKDPRLSVLFPLWENVLKELGIKVSIAICTRQPSEVAASLLRRDQIETNHSLLLWLYYQLCSEFYTRQYPREFVNYADLISNPGSEVDRVLGSLGMGEVTVPPERLNIDQRLRHVDGAGIEVPVFIQSLYAAFCEQSDISEVEGVWKILFPLLKLTPDVLRLERLLSSRLSDLELCKQHIENLEDNFLLEKTGLVRTIEELQEGAQRSSELNKRLQAEQAESEKLVVELKCKLDKAQVELSENAGRMDTLARELEISRSSVENLSLEYGALRDSYLEITSSEFWRLTYPLRKVVQWLRRPVSKNSSGFYSIAFKPDRDIQLAEGRYRVSGAFPRLRLVPDQNDWGSGTHELTIDASLGEAGYLQVEFELKNGAMVESDVTISDGKQNVHLILPEAGCGIILIPKVSDRFDLTSCSLIKRG